MDQIINTIGELSCSAFYGIGADSIANAMKCYLPLQFGSLFNYVSAGWYTIIGAFFLLGGGGFFFWHDE